MPDALFTAMLDVYLTIGLESLILLLFFLNFRKATPEQKLVGTLMLVCFPFELYAGYLQTFKENNLFIYHFLTPVQYTFYAFIYYSAISSGKVKKVIIFSVPVVILAALVLGFTVQQVREYNSYAIVLSNFLILAWVLTYYRQTFVQLKIYQLEREPLFWISTGLLFYALGGFFVEGLMNNLLENSKEVAKKYYYSVTVVLLCFLYLMFIFSFLCRRFFKSYD